MSGRLRLLDAALALALVVASVWLASLVYHNYLGGHAAPPAAGTIGRAPGLIVATTLDGLPASLRPAELEHPLLLLVIAADCGFCVDDVPVWRALIEAPGPEVLILSASGPDATRAFLAAHGLSQHCLLIDGAEVQNLGLTGVPATVALGPGAGEMRVWMGVLGERERAEIAAWAAAANGAATH